MNIVGLGLSQRQMSKLRNGHRVRVKKGTGCNVIVSPQNYNILTRAFSKSKGAEIQLTPEEIELNRGMSPEQHQALLETADTSLASMEGTGLFAGGKINVGKAFKQAGRSMKKAWESVERTGKKQDWGGKFETVKKAIPKKLVEEGVKAALMSQGLDEKQANIAAGASTGALYKTDFSKKPQAQDALMGGLQGGIQGSMKKTKAVKIEGQKPEIGKGLYAGGRGLYAGGGFADLDLQTRGSLLANKQFAGLDKKFVDGLHYGGVEKKYWDGAMDPPSRGSGLKSRLNDRNLIRGRGSLISQDIALPPAMRSQPYGENYQMKNMLPPEYQKFFENNH